MPLFTVCGCPEGSRGNDALKDKLWRLLWIAGLVILADLATKEIILYKVALYESLEVIPGFFSITHVRNTGAAFGLFAGHANGFRILFFLAMTCVALAVVLFMYAKTAEENVWVSRAFCLIAGGAVGNFVDRVRFGEVVDFLDFYVGSAHWPTFNVADSAISIGVGLLFFYAVTNKI